MLKKIPVHQLRLGMHLHKLEGAWIEHPFWRTKFVIDSAQDLQRLHECGVADCWIDIALGLDVAPPALPAHRRRRHRTNPRPKLSQRRPSPNTRCRSS